MIEPIPIVGIAFIKNNQVLIVKSAKSAKNDLFTLVGGSVEEGETILEGCKREIKEEVDYNLDVLDEELEFITSYVEPAASDPNLLINMHLFIAHHDIDGVKNCNPEIIESKWFKVGDQENISSSIKDHLIPYAIKNGILK